MGMISLGCSYILSIFFSRTELNLLRAKQQRRAYIFVLFVNWLDLLQ